MDSYFANSIGCGSLGERQSGGAKNHSTLVEAHRRQQVTQFAGIRNHDASTRDRRRRFFELHGVNVPQYGRKDRERPLTGCLLETVKPEQRQPRTRPWRLARPIA
jgi:hypothetical protein